MISKTQADARPVISPFPGSPFAAAFHDIREALRLAPVWLHAGWIDIVWRFRRTWIGPFWHTLGLAAFVLVMGVIWSKILNQDPFSYFRYVTISLIVWGLIAAFINDGTSVLVMGQTTALSMKFPYIAFAFAAVWRALLLFAHHFILYIFVMAISLYWPGLTVLYAIPALALLVANGLWISILVGMVCLRWRDLAPATATFMQIAMFITPVFWPKDMLGPKFAYVADFNPLFHLVEVLRDPLLGKPPVLANWVWSLGTLVVGSLITLWFYGRHRDRISYWY